MRLSILIPTLPQRAHFLARLQGILAPQLTSDIEVLTDPCEKASIGAKRNALIARATGDYVAFIDDDDRVSPDYIRELMAGIDKGVDVVSIRGVYTHNGCRPRAFIDRPHRPWGQEENGTYLRNTQHLDAVKREIASQALFPDKSFGEDQEWGAKVEATGLVKTWHEVGHAVYFYEFRSPK